MFNNISISYQGWTVAAVVATALFYTLLLYYKNKNGKLPAKWIVPLSILRFLSVFLIAFLLLSPYMVIKNKNVQKPLLIFAQDNSASILLNDDSAWYLQKYPLLLHKLYRNLSPDFDIDTLLFGSQVTAGGTPGFKDGVSDYGMLFNKIASDFAGEKTAAMIVAGDGIFNRGFDPSDAATNVTFPVFTLLLGDTTHYSDLKIREVRCNSIVYKNDIFPVEVTVLANGMKGVNAKLLITDGKKKVSEKKITVTGDRFNKTLKFFLSPEKAGKIHYKISFVSQAHENNENNNHYDLFVNVLKNRQKILVLVSSPHPDVAALRRSLENGKDNRVEVRNINGKLPAPLNYDLIILHGIPRNYSEYKTVKNIQKREIPLLFILGSGMDFSLFNRLNAGLQVKSTIGKTEDALAHFNKGFTLFGFDEDDGTALEQMPPLIVPFGNWSFDPAFSVLAYQKVAGLNTKYPLLVFGEKGGVKTGFVCGEGLWLWRIHDFLKFDNTAAFDNLVTKSVQYLVTRTDKRLFKVKTREKYNLLSDIVIGAELYDKAYNPVANAEISLKLTGENGDVFNYSFLPEEKTYSLNLGRLPAGVYHYEAVAQQGKETYTDKGSFVVNNVTLESMNTVASAAILNRLSSQHRGKMFFKENIDSIPYYLKKSGKFPKTISYNERYKEFLDILVVALLIFLLLALEWFLRKFFGNY